MKRVLLLILFITVQHYHYAMELSKEEAENLWWDTAYPIKKYQVEELPYEQYRENMLQAIPLVEEKQHHYHNPLISAVHKGDYEFTKFLLEQKLSPVFRGMNQMDAFDALRLKNGGIMTAEKPFEIYKQFVGLLMSYLKEGDKHTQSPLASANGNYFRDDEFKEFILKNKQAYIQDSQFKKFIHADLSRRYVDQLEAELSAEEEIDGLVDKFDEVKINE